MDCHVASLQFATEKPGAHASVALWIKNAISLYLTFGMVNFLLCFKNLVEAFAYDWLRTKSVGFVLYKRRPEALFYHLVLRKLGCKDLRSLSKHITLWVRQERDQQEHLRSLSVSKRVCGLGEYSCTWGVCEEVKAYLRGRQVGANPRYVEAGLPSLNPTLFVILFWSPFEVQVIVKHVIIKVKARLMPVLKSKAGFSTNNKAGFSTSNMRDLPNYSQAAGCLGTINAFCLEVRDCNNEPENWERCLNSKARLKS